MPPPDPAGAPPWAAAAAAAAAACPLALSGDGTSVSSSSSPNAAPMAAGGVVMCRWRTPPIMVMSWCASPCTAEAAAFSRCSRVRASEGVDGHVRVGVRHMRPARGTDCGEHGAVVGARRHDMPGSGTAPDTRSLPAGSTQSSSSCRNSTSSEHSDPSSTMCGRCEPHDRPPVLLTTRLNTCTPARRSASTRSLAVVHPGKRIDTPPYRGCDGLGRPGTSSASSRDAVRMSAWATCQFRARKRHVLRLNTLAAPHRTTN